MNKNIIEQSILLDIESTEMQYKYHTDRQLKIQQKLDNIIFKKSNDNKIKKLIKELNDETQKVDKYFNMYIKACEQLYIYHAKGLKKLQNI